MVDTFRLIELAQAGDEEALELLVKNNMGLVVKVVSRFFSHGMGYDREDLLQVGAMGLLKAIRNFDLSRGLQFSTYAYPCIIGEVRRYLQKQAPLKISSDLYSLGLALRRDIREHKAATGQEPKLSEVSARLNVSSEKALLAMESLRHPLSMEADFLVEENVTLHDLVGREELDLDTIFVRQALNTLDNRSRYLIYLRYYRGLTQEQTAERLGLSQVHVSRLERQIMTEIKGCLQE